MEPQDTCPYTNDKALFTSRLPVGSDQQLSTHNRKLNETQSGLSFVLPKSKEKSMDFNSLMTMRSQIFEQYAQVHADLDALKNLESRADSINTPKPDLTLV